MCSCARTRVCVYTCVCVRVCTGVGKYSEFTMTNNNGVHAKKETMTDETMPR